MVTHEQCTLSNGIYELFIDQDKDYMSVVGSVDGRHVTHELQDLFSNILWRNEATGCFVLLFVCHPMFATFPLSSVRLLGFVLEAWGLVEVVYAWGLSSE